MAEQTTSQPAVEFKRVENFLSLYANNVQFESSLWDIKFIFGILNQHEGREIVQQHTSINVPWLQMKVMTMYLVMTLAAHEIWNGKLNIPPQFLPTIPPPSEDITDQNALAVLEAWNKILEQFK